jgi:preprotein translocase subunit SecE
MSGKSQGWFGQSKQYINEVQGEFNKITWPPQIETMNGTVSVVVIVVLVAGFLGVVDFFLSRIMQQVLG